MKKRRNVSKDEIAEIIELLESPKFCEFQKERGLCDGVCETCRKRVIDVLEGMTGKRGGKKMDGGK